MSIFVILVVVNLVLTMVAYRVKSEKPRKILMIISFVISVCLIILFLWAFIFGSGYVKFSGDIK